MFLLVAGRAQSRGRSDEPIRTQRDRSRSRDRPIASRRTKRRSEKESDSSNNYPPIVIGPVTTNQDLNAKGEKVYNLPLMIQQPFLREKKEPIKVDISVKLIPKPRKKDKKRRDVQVEEIIIQSEENKGVINSFSMEVTDGSVQVLKQSTETIEAEVENCTEDDKSEIKEEGPSNISNVELEKLTEQSVEMSEINENLVTSKVEESMEETANSEKLEIDVCEETPISVSEEVSKELPENIEEIKEGQEQNVTNEVNAENNVVDTVLNVEEEITQKSSEQKENSEVEAS